MTHSLIRPASPSTLIHAAILASGHTRPYVSTYAGIKPERLRAILDGANPTKREVHGLAVALDRWWVALWREIRDARRACQAWDEREAELAKERRRE